MGTRRTPAPPAPPSPPKTYSQTEFAEQLGVSRGTLYNMRKRLGNKMPLPINMGLKNLRFRCDEVDAFVRYGLAWRLR